MFFNSNPFTLLVGLIYWILSSQFCILGFSGLIVLPKYTLVLVQVLIIVLLLLRLRFLIIILLLWLQLLRLWVLLIVLLLRVVLPVCLRRVVLVLIWLLSRWIICILVILVTHSEKESIICFVFILKADINRNNNNKKQEYHSITWVYTLFSTVANFDHSFAILCLKLEFILQNNNSLPLIVIVYF